MAASYKKLFKLLIDRDMKKKELAEKAGIKGSVECLSFMKVDCDLNESEYVFEGEHIKQMEYIAHQVQHGKKEGLDLGAINMLPIINAFKLLKTKEQPTD